MEKVAKIAWNEFIYGGHLIALGPVVIVYVVSLFLSWSTSLPLLFTVYLVPFLIHYFDRYHDIENESSSERIHHLSRSGSNFRMVTYSGTFVVLALSLFQSSLITVIALSLLFVGFSYTIFLKKLTSYIIGFKSYYVALAFPSVILLLVAYNNTTITLPVILLYSFFALRWFTNTIFCDYKDRKQDKEEHLKTFAAVLPEKLFYPFLFTLNILSVLPLIIGALYGLLPLSSLILILTSIYGYGYISLAKNKQIDFQKASNILADGESVIWLILGVIGGIWA